MSREAEILPRPDARLPLKPQIAEGMRDMVPLFAAASPFGIVFGAAASASGYTFFETVFASLTMFAGASQFVFIEINGAAVPAWSVMLAVFAVNFRHILYSASIGRAIRHFSFLQKAAGFFLLTDIQFAAMEARSERQQLTPAYYFGFGLPLYAMWIGTTALGALFGKLVEHPEMLGLDFILPIYFLALLMGFRKRQRFVLVGCIAGLVSLLVFKTLGQPWHISLGALAGVAAAAIAVPGKGGQNV